MWGEEFVGSHHVSTQAQQRCRPLRRPRRCECCRCWLRCRRGAGGVDLGCSGHGGSRQAASSVAMVVAAAAKPRRWGRRSLCRPRAQRRGSISPSVGLPCLRARPPALRIRVVAGSGVGGVVAGKAGAVACMPSPLARAAAVAVPVAPPSQSRSLPAGHRNNPMQCCRSGPRPGRACCWGTTPPRKPDANSLRRRLQAVRWAGVTGTGRIARPRFARAKRCGQTVRFGAALLYAQRWVSSFAGSAVVSSFA